MPPDGRHSPLTAKTSTLHSFDDALIMVASQPGRAPSIRISEAGGLWPRWATDGRTLYYRSAESLMATPVEPGPKLRAGKARAVLTVPGKAFRFDTHPDGRILLALSEGTAERSHEVRLLRGALAGPV